MTGRTNEYMQDATSRLTLIHPSQPLAAQFLQLGISTALRTVALTFSPSCLGLH